jgi:hypothetical protein
MGRTRVMTEEELLTRLEAHIKARVADEMRRLAEQAEAKLERVETTLETKFIRSAHYDIPELMKEHGLCQRSAYRWADLYGGFLIGKKLYIPRANVPGRQRRKKKLLMS